MICPECDSEAAHKTGCLNDMKEWSFLRRWRFGVWFSRQAEYSRGGLMAVVGGWRWAKIWATQEDTDKEEIKERIRQHPSQKEIL